mmetsp:Transcript_46579/g.86526  ORF Transcript_46579/g.86526 Transcript_46579/m.86526 type:complete len:472 (-) Transcript_46579:365-1780(-)
MKFSRLPHSNLFLAFLCIMYTSSATKTAAMDIGTFLWISDVHLDDYYGTSNGEVHKHGAPCQNNGSDLPYYSAYGCGTSHGLLESAIDSVSQVIEKGEVPKPDFIMFTGDSTRHDTQDVKLHGFNSSKASISYVVNEAMSTVYNGLEQRFPDVSIVALPSLDLGNNDLLGDYLLNVTSDAPCLAIENGSDGPILPNATNPWLIHVADRFKHLFVDDEEYAVFACGGYMNRRLHGGLRLISLNTMVWSLRHEPIVPNGTDPFGEHSWLRVQLEAAKSQGDKVYLTGHVPPMLQSYQGTIGKPLWRNDHIARFFDAVAAYSDTVAGLFFAHVHSNELRAVPGLPEDSPPMLITGSLSPCYTTTPFYSFVSYDRGETKFPVDLVTYNLNLEVHNASTPADRNPWERLFPSLTSFLGMSSLTNRETKLLAARLAAKASRIGAPDGNDAFEKYFQTWYKVSSLVWARVRCLPFFTK